MGRAGPDEQTGALPRWLKAQYALVTGVLLCLLVLVLTLGFLRYERGEIEDRALADAALYARMLEDHANRTLNAADLTLRSLTDALPEGAADLATIQRDAGLQRALRDALSGQPYLRGIVLVDADGQVLLSTNARNLGERVDLALLGAPTGAARDSAGVYLPGRDLSDWLAGALPATRRGFVPMLQRVTLSLRPPGAAGQLAAQSELPAFWVLMFNPDYFANAYELALDNSGHRAALMNFSAQLLATTDGVEVAPGQRLPEYWSFTHFLPKREQGQWIGPGLDGRSSVAAFRTARSRPWLVMVELPYERVQAQLAAVAATVGAAALATGAVILLLSFVAWRGLRAHADGLTALHEAERQARLAQAKAELADQAKTEFLANISHELRTPLQSILGFAELGQGRAEEASKLQTLFTRIHGAGGRMLALVNDLLDLSRLDSRPDFTLTRQPLAPLLDAVLAELQPLADRRRLRVLLAPPLAPDRMADVDGLALSQVLRNVLANALRFAPEGSDIDIGAHELAGGGLEIRLRDRGPGIPEAELEAIFDAFVQSTRTKSGAGGTGLGLSICRRIMDGHGGAIQASNHAEGGAVFSISLPAPAAASV